MQRYDIAAEYFDAWMAPCEDGEYVRYENAVALEAERDQYKADAERFMWWFEMEQRGFDKLPTTYLMAIVDSVTIDKWRTYIDEQRAKT